jgi:hypothetical protein
MDHNLEIALVVFVAVAAIALILQLATLLGMFFAVKKIQGQAVTVLGQVTSLMPQITSIVNSTKRTVETVEGHVKTIGDSSVSIMDVTKHQVMKIDELLTDITMRTKVQVERAEMVMEDTMGRAQETVSIVQRSVLRPIREIHGVLSGVRTTFAHLSRTGRPTVDHATSDEEMFI